MQRYFVEDLIDTTPVWGMACLRTVGVIAVVRAEREGDLIETETSQPT